MSGSVCIGTVGIWGHLAQLGAIAGGDLFTALGREGNEDNQSVSPYVKCTDKNSAIGAPLSQDRG